MILANPAIGFRSFSPFRACAIRFTEHNIKNRADPTSFVAARQLEMRQRADQAANIFPWALVYTVNTSFHTSEQIRQIEHDLLDS